MSEKIQTTAPDVFPRISFDIDHGEYVDDIDVDLEAVTKQLRDGGLSDEEIAELTIHFATSELGTDGDYGVVHGSYDRARERIEASHMRVLEETKYGYHDDIVSMGVDEHFSYGASGIYSGTLAHELEHAIAARDPEQQKRNHKYLSTGFVRKVRESHPGMSTPSFIALFALDVIRTVPHMILRKDGYPNYSLKYDAMSRNTYINHPEEVRARAAGAAAPEDLVKITPIQ